MNNNQNIADIQSATVEMFTTLADCYAFYLTRANSHSKQFLVKFAFLLTWPTLNTEQKQAKYSEFACHELNFFVSKKVCVYVYVSVFVCHLRSFRMSSSFISYVIFVRRQIVCVCVYVCVCVCVCVCV